jgi:DNA-binding LacI/PurR family transcriptional regulator
MAELQVTHLLELGHRRLLFVGFETISQVIESGWKKAAAMLGLGADRAYGDSTGEVIRGGKNLRL